MMTSPCLGHSATSWTLEDVSRTPRIEAQVRDLLREPLRAATCHDRSLLSELWQRIRAFLQRAPRAPHPEAREHSIRIYRVGLLGTDVTHATFVRPRRPSGFSADWHRGAVELVRRIAP